jgi:alpha-tubulin suppressor-like RCC1 family protein
MKRSSVFERAHCLSSILILAALGWSAPRAIAQKPAMVAQPKSQNICAGFNAVFNASATGLPTMHYQWQHEGSDLAGASGLGAYPTLTLTNVQPADTGAYRVLITNNYGSVTSLEAVLVVGTLAAWGNSWTSPTNLAMDLTNLLTIAGGGGHCLGLREDHTVVGWGRNTSGQTNVPAQLNNVVAIAAGDAHSLALRDDGTVVAWGDNTYSQTNVPAGLTNAAQIAARGNWSMAIRADGTVVVWGGGGSDTFGVRNIPFGLKAAAVDAGAYHCLALTWAGTVVAWGNNGNGQATVPAGLSNVVAVAAKPYGSLALKADGTIVGWGSATTPGNASNIVAIAAGDFANLALRRDGAVLAWGSSNTNVPAGFTNGIAVSAGSAYVMALRNFGGPVLTVTPASQAAWSGQTVTLCGVATGAAPLSYQWRFNGADIADATDSSLALNSVRETHAGDYVLIVSNSLGSVTSPVATLRVRQTLTVAAWGANSNGQCNVPPDLVNMVGLAAADHRSLALQEDGTVMAWGASAGYQSLRPSSLSNVVALAGGDFHNLALRDNGSIVTWGTPASSICTNSALVVDSFTAIAAGAYHCLGLRADGTVRGWNDAYDSPGASTPPAGLSGAVAVAGGLSHSLALKADGTVISWGPSYNGYASVPAGLSNVVAIACGYSHDLALRQDGTVVAWGANDRGQTDVPRGLTNVVAIASYGYHSLALKTDRTLISWGWNQDGQSTVPTGLSNVVAIAAGMSHSLALIGDSAPCLTAEPQPQTNEVGSTATLQVRAAGTRPLLYQWQFRGADIQDATNSILVLTGVRLDDAGEYRCVVSNALGLIISSPAVLTVLRPPPVFDTSPSGLQLTNGEVRLTLAGLAETGPVVLYSSTNLVDWVPVVTNPPSSGTLLFRDPQILEGSRFYRASEGQ